MPDRTSSDFNRMRQRGTAPLGVIAGVAAGLALLLFLVLSASPEPADAKTRDLSVARAVDLDSADGGTDWTLDQERLISTAAAKRTSPRPVLPQVSSLGGGPDDPPFIPRRLHQKVPAAEDPSPH